MKTISRPLLKNILTGLLLIFIGLRTTAQTVTNYTFAGTSGTFTALTGGATTTWTGNTDDAVSALIPIGFDFWYMGTRYTTLSASTNGWFSFGSVLSDNLYTNNLATGGTPRPVIAPFWDDLDIVANANVTYKTTGTAGSRIFTLQYLNVKWNYQALGSVCSFQVRLYEGTGKIEYIYRSEALAANSPSASIGITATTTGSGSFLSVNNSGSNVSSTNEANITTKRATGATYSFTPPVPTAPSSLSFSGVSNSAMTLNWSDLSSNENGFLIYRSTDNVNFTFITQTAANTTTAAQTGLTDNTTYYWKVYAVSEGGVSTALSGSRATFCTPPAAPVVTSPVTYCLNATAAQLTATGTNLMWSTGSAVTGSAGGTATLSTTTFVDGVNTGNNRKTIFSTNTNNVTISSVDYYIPSFQAVTGIVLGIFNNSGTLIATSSTSTTQTAGASAIQVTNIFNYTIAAAGSYSIGLVSGSGVIGSDNPAFPITEPTGTITITGVSVAGSRCFNNIQFSNVSSTAPVPSTATAGSSNYFVTQTVNGCTSPAATITVNVTSPNISQLPAGNLIANYTFSGNANDATGNDNGTLQNAPALTADRFGIANKAYTFNGSSQYISTATAYVNPTNFTISIWFKTNTTTGGKLIGFGREQTGSSGQYDRHIYMNNAGQLYFGIYSGTVSTVSSVLSYNDNNWHLATATLSSTAGMTLYVDGAQVGANAAATLAENYTGYWRIGYDNNNSWTSQPSSFYFNGTLDDAVIYHRALTAGEVAVLYTSPDGAGNNGPACSGTAITLSATTLGGATYAWTGPNSYTASTQNPSFTYTPTNAGVYTVNVTVNGCTATAYTNVTSTTNAGQWTGNISTDWTDGNNWCTGTVPTATTNVVISSTAARQPALNGTASCNSLTVNAGATLTIGAAGTINIAGTFTNNGTVTNNGTTVFNGSSGQQTFSGINTFYNLTLSNSSGLLLPAAITVNNNLTITSGTLNANNFGTTVKGNWTNNGSAAAFAAGTSTVTFNGAAAQTIGGTFPTTFNNLTIANTAAAVTLSANINIDGNLTVSTGILDLAGFTANRTSAGGILTVANNATLKIGGTNTFPVNYTTNTLVVASNVEYAGAAQTVANQTYGNLIVSSAAGAAAKTFPATAMTVLGNLVSTPGAGTSVSFTAGADITVNGNVTIGASTTFNAGAFAQSVSGNWTNNGTFNGNTGTVTFTGAGATVGGTGTTNFNNLTVAGSLVNFTAGNISLSGNLATTGAGSFSQASGGTLLMTGSGTTISGTGISLDNLSVSGSVSTISALTLTGNLSVSGSFTTGAGTFTMNGSSKTMTGAGTISFGLLSVTGTVTTNAAFSLSSALSVNGSFSATAGTATFTGSSTLSGMANLFNVTINGTSLQLSANATLGIANTLTITAGTLNVTASTPNTVNFNGAGAQTVNAITYANLVLSGGGAKTAAGNITTNYDITIGAGTTFDPSSYTHIIYGSWINNGTFIPATSTVSFVGAATSYIQGATTFNILTSNTSNATTELVLQSHVSAAIVNMTNGTISTGQDTITITNTRTGNGKIQGNVQRNHAFTTGVAYAFKDPYNTITFAAVSGVTSITVSILDNINDFPFNGSINEECRIAVPAGTYNATLSLGYEDAALNGNNESSMALWHYSGSSWTAVGKTANDATLNYVTQSGLTDITGRWTLSDNANHVQWNGSVSSDWHTAANWTAISGSPSRPPSATDIVDLGTVTFNFQPTISAGAVAKNIVFGSAKAVTLTITTGGSLTTSGNIAGTWSAAATHTINVNNQNLTVNGDLNLGDGTNGHAIDLTIGAGTVNIGGTMTEDGGANINFTGAGVLNLAGDFNHNSGTFTGGTGTVVYNGTDNQLIAHVSYNNLTVNKTSGLARIDAATTIMGDLLITAGQLDNLSPLTIAGNVTINTGTTLNDAGMLYVGGNWTNQGTYTGTGAQVTFNGSGTQNISASGFNNLVINKPVGSSAILTGDIVLNGDLTITSGTFNGKTFNCTRTVQGGTITMADSATVIIGGNNPPVNFSSYYYARSSTLILDGVIPQFLGSYGGSFGNVTFRNTGVKNVVTAISISGNLTIESGTSLNGGSNTITLGGSWIDNGTFIPATSTVLFTGTAQNIIGNTVFNNATVTGSYTILQDVTFNTLLNITSTGSLSGGSSIHTTMNGDLINSGVLYTLGTTTFTGNVLQTLSLINAPTTVALTVFFNGSVSPVLNSTSVPQFGYLTINNTGGINPSVGWNILYSLTIGSGASFNGGPSTHNILGGVTNNGTMTSSGRLNFTPSTAATVNLGSNFSSTGTVAFGGAGALTLAGTADSFHNVIISNTNIAGVAPPAGWIISNNLNVNTGSILQAGGYSYSVGGNIMNNGTINSGTSTFTLNGASQQTMYSSSAFNHLTINKSAGIVTLLNDMTVNGILNFISGNIETSDYRLILPAAGSVTGAAQNTGWVFGKLQKNIATGATVKQFEVGDGLNYTPVDIAFSSVSTAGDLVASSTQYDHPQISSSAINASRSVNRYWTLANNGILFNDYSATFHFVATDVDPGTDAAAIIAGRYSDGAWTYPTIGAITATSIQATGLTAFIDFQIGDKMIYVKTWDGGAGTRNWGDAANWNTDGVPTATDKVELTHADTIDIDVAAVAKNLLLNNSALILSIQPGRSLAVAEDLSLIAGTFNTAAAFPSVSGITDVTGGTVGFTGSSTQNIPALQYNNLISSSTGNRILPATGIVGIAGAFSPGTNIYTITGSTVDYNGSDTQRIAAFNYQHLTLSNAGGKTFGKDTTGIAGVLSITGGATPITDSSTISYNGSTNQTIVPITYFNLHAANGAGVVTITDATINNNLSVANGTLAIGDNNTARTITVNGNITIATGATLQVATASDADHQLTLRGNITNNGILDLRPDAGSLCDMVFNKEGVQTITGTGTLANFNHITVNEGSSNSNYLEVNTTNFSAPDGFLTLINGSFQLNSTGAAVTPFTTDIATGNYLIPASAGLWVNAGTIRSVAMNWTVAGLVKVTGGTLNMGNAADNVVIPKPSAIFTTTAGNLNLASRISNPGGTWTFLMKGGTTTVNSKGSSAAGIAPFNMDAAGSVFDMSGGQLVIQQAGGTPTEHFGYNNLSTAGPGFTGGTLVMGNIATPAAQTMEITSATPVYNLTVNSANATAILPNDLTVANNVSVTAGALNIDSYTLKIGGGIVSNGALMAGNGTIELNGAAAQTIPAAAFAGDTVRNLTINNTAGVTLNGNAGITGILLAANGQFATGGYLTLLSTASKTALIDGSGLGDVLGNVTMQRFLQTGFGYKYFSSPFQAATVNEFADDINLGASFPTFYRYDENLLSTGWIKYTNTSGLLDPGAGYAANLGAAATPVTVDMTGVVNNNTVTLPALYNHNRTYTQGFNLVGNPYSSPVDWDAATGWSRTNIDNAVYYFDAGTTNQYTGTYSSYINGVSSNGIANNVIPAMQAFFVHVSAGAYPVTAAMSVNNHARINNLAPDFHRRSPMTLPLLRLSAGFAAEKAPSDPMVLYFDDADGKKTFDQEMDALKMMNTDSLVPNLYVIAADTSKLSICAWTGLQDTADIIPLGLRTLRTGWINLQTVAAERIPAGRHIYLYDAKTGISQDVQNNPQYRVFLEAGEYGNRFFLLFRSKKEAPTTTPVTSTGVFEVYNSGGRLTARLSNIPGDKCTVMITNMLGQVMMRKQLEGNGSHELGSSFKNGVYVVSFYTQQQQVVSKKIFIGN